jgi:hypothetical protein
VGQVLRIPAGNRAAKRPTPSSGAVCCALQRCSPKLQPSPLHFRRSIMGKYILAWLLGVPGIVLLLVYLFFH